MSPETILEDAAVQEVVDEAVKGIEVEQDQTVEKESEEAGNQAGEVKEEAGTATAEKEADGGNTGLEAEKEEGLTPEEIMSSAPKSDIEKAKEGTDPGVQKRINRAVGAQKDAEDRAKAAEGRITELEAIQASPTEKPMVPVESSFETTELYQAAYDKFQTGLNAYNKAQDSQVKQAEEATVRDQENTDRLVVQKGELKTRFPDGVKYKGKMVDVVELIDNTDYGYARQAISNSKHSGKIGVYLATHDAERIRVGSIVNPEDRGVAVGELSALFEPKKDKTTSAPAELGIVDGDGGGGEKGGGEPTTADMEKMSREVLNTA